MENIKIKDKSSPALFVISLVFKLLFAVSFLLMPAASSLSLNQEKNGLLYFAGVLFWASLIISQLTMLFVTLKQKKYFADNNRSGLPKYPAIFTFFYSKEAKIIDILMFVVIVAFIITVIATDSYLIYVFLFLSALMIQAHCVLNGKNLIYIKELKSGGNA